MRHDTALTFGDIHGSADTLLSSIEELERHALVRQPARDAPLCFRLLRVPAPVALQNNSISLYLTDKETHNGKEWVTVSYCWAHSESPPDGELPKYRIKSSPSNQWRAREPSCPVQVLHRAVQYAQARNCRYIWIDQECINQKDPLDIEYHLQVNHRIYANSLHTIAILACTLPTQSMMDALLYFLTTPSDNIPAKLPHVHPVRRVLWHICHDRWFKRAWTFQERQCTSNLVFLIPSSPALTVPAEHRSLLVGRDLCAPSTVFSRQLGGFGEDEWEHGYTINYSWSDYSAFFHKWDTRALSSMTPLFKYLESCDITIAADKVAIYGNVNSMEQTLQTTLLRDTGSSYSTCLLALFMVYKWPDKEKRREKYSATKEKLLLYTIRDFFQRRGWAPENYCRCMYGAYSCLDNVRACEKEKERIYD